MSYQEDAEARDYEREMVAAEMERSRGTGQVDTGPRDWIEDDGHQYDRWPHRPRSRLTCTGCGETHATEVAGAVDEASGTVYSDADPGL